MLPQAMMYFVAGGKYQGFHYLLRLGDMGVIERAADDGPRFADSNQLTKQPLAHTSDRMALRSTLTIWPQSSKRRGVPCDPPTSRHV